MTWHACDHDSRSLVEARFESVKSELIIEKVVRRFRSYFFWNSSSFCYHPKPWSQRSWKKWHHFSFSSLSKLEQFSWPAALWQAGKGKASRECCRRIAFGHFSKLFKLMFTSKFWLCFSWTRQTSLRDAAPVPVAVDMIRAKWIFSHCKWIGWCR